jgi:Rrf2 family iron-sulfur cluster assembly transcriptional regulator
MTHDLWTTLNRKMNEYLSSVSLQQLVDSQRQKHSAVLGDAKQVSRPLVQARAVVA